MKQLDSKTSFLSEWEHKKIKRTFSPVFMKLGMIFMLCLMGLNLPAQTALQSQIYNAPLNSKIRIDNVDWYVVKKATQDGKNYAFLVSVRLFGPLQFSTSSNNSYQNSQLRANMDLYYQSYLNTLRPIAVVPDLGDFSSENATSELTTTLAENRTNDILFAPSYRDMYIWNGNKTTPLEPYLKEYVLRFWTRTPSASVALYVWEVNPPNDYINSTAQASGSINAVGGIWVQCSPIGPSTYTVTYYGNGNTGGTAPAAASFNANSTVTVAGPGTLAKTDHMFQGWATSASATTPNYVYNGSTFNPSGFTITGNTDLYAVWKDICGSPVIWTPEANSGSGKNNWNNANNWTPAIVPSSCTNVFIPGNSTYYPNLTSAAECKDIYFIQGAELGRPDLLTYQRAYVQLNFSLKQFEQQKNGDKDLLLNSTDTRDRMLFSAAVSSAPLERERWYMLSSPLRNVITGDLGFGGFPLTFLKKFGPVNKDNINYPVGEWTTPYTSMTEPVASTTTDGYAFYMYGYEQGGSEERNSGCSEIGLFGQLNELNYLPNRNMETYGLWRINGILELPFFADSTNLYAHRTQVYDPSSNTSTFYYVDESNLFTGKTIPVTRDNNGGNYRFAPEIYNAVSNSWLFLKEILHPTSGLSDGDDFLVGNPYMSSIDMLAFFNDNPSSVNHSFRIWDGNDFISCAIDVSTGIITPTSASDMRYIAPLQGFLLTYKGGDVRFNVENISTVRPAGSSFNLRSAQEMREENLLRIKAENQSAASYAVIGHQEGASIGYIQAEDVRKLFSPFGYVPEVYSLADDVPVDINFIDNNSDAVIPLGIKTEQLGEIRLTFTGMDHYVKASKIEFVDALEDCTIDLTGLSSYTYAFNNTEKGIQNGRFLLRIGGTSMTALPNAISDILNIYGSSKGIFVISSPSDPVLQITVYDFQGRKVYESTSGAGYYPLQEKPDHSPMIVKAVTKNRVKTVKINY